MSNEVQSRPSIGNLACIRALESGDPLGTETAMGMVAEAYIAAGTKLEQQRLQARVSFESHVERQISNTAQSSQATHASNADDDNDVIEIDTTTEHDTLPVADRRHDNVETTHGRLPHSFMRFGPKRPIQDGRVLLPASEAQSQPMAGTQSVTGNESSPFAPPAQVKSQDSEESQPRPKRQVKLWNQAARDVMPGDRADPNGGFAENLVVEVAVRVLQHCDPAPDSFGEHFVQMSLPSPRSGPAADSTAEQEVQSRQS